MATVLGSSQSSTTPVPQSADRALVVVVAHDGRRFLDACLRSLLLAGVDAARVIVVDNDSADGSSALIHNHFPAVQVLHSTVNLGYGGASNLGVREAGRTAGVWDGVEYLAFLNQDVVSGPGWVDQLVAALDRDPSAAVATPKILLKSDPGLVNACGNNVHPTGITTCRGYGRPASEHTSTTPVAAVSGAAFVIRKQVFEALGGFDPLFFMYLEDTDLSLRVALAGFGAVSVPDAVVYHDFEPSFASSKVHWLERNRVVLLAKLFRWRSLLLLFPALVVTELLVLAYASVHGPGVVVAKAQAYTWLIRNIARVRESRRRTQARRRISDRELLARFAWQLDVTELRDWRATFVAALANALYGAWWRIARRVIAW